MTLKQTSGYLFSIFFRGCKFEIDYAVSKQESISRLTAGSSFSVYERKFGEFSLSAFDENIDQFSFKKLKNRTVIAFEGVIESRSDTSVHIIGHAKIAGATKVWILYFLVIGVIFLKFLPLLSIVATAGVIGLILFSVRDCKQAPQELYKMLNNN